MSDPRKQINFRATDQTLDRIDTMRSQLKPVPNVSELMHMALDALEREIARNATAQSIRTNGNHFAVADNSAVRLAHVR